MKKVKLTLGILVFLGILILPDAAASPVKIDGTWLGRLEVPGFESSDITLVIEEAESGYVGVLNDSAGWWPQDVELEDIKLKKDKLSFSSKITDGTTVILFRLTVTDDTMTGEVENTAIANPDAIVLIEFNKKK